MERRCTGCDTSLPPIARFCPACGDHAQPSTTSSETPHTAAGDRPAGLTAAPTVARDGGPATPPDLTASTPARPEPTPSTTPRDRRAPGTPQDAPGRRVPIVGLLAAAAVLVVVAAAVTTGPLPPADDPTTVAADGDDPLDVLDGSSHAAAELGGDGDAPGRTGPDGQRPTRVRQAGAPSCEPAGCELWRATLRTSRVPVATTADRIAYLDGTRLVVREAERGRPAAIRDLATVLRRAPLPSDARATAADEDDDGDGSSPDAPSPPDTATIDERLTALAAALEATAPSTLALQDGSVAATVGPVLVVLEPGGEPRWARVLDDDVRDLRLAGDSVVAVTRPADDAAAGANATLVTYDLGVGTQLDERTGDLLLLDTEVAVLREDTAIVGLDLASSDQRWSRAAGDEDRARADAGLVLVPGDADTEVVRPDGTTVLRLDGVVAAVVAVPDGYVLVARSALTDDDTPGGSSGRAVRGEVVAVDGDGAVRWTRSLGDLAVDAGAEGDDLVTAQQADAVVCCPRLYPSVGPAGILLEILEDVGVVVGLRDGEAVAVGAPDALQRELFFTTVTNAGDRQVRRSGNRWELADVGGEEATGDLTLVDARAVVGTEPLVVLGERTLLVVRPVPRTDG